MSHPKGINARQHSPAAALGRPRTIPTTGGGSPPTLTTTATLGRGAGPGDRWKGPQARRYGENGPRGRGPSPRTAPPAGAGGDDHRAREESLT
jgi:hypothetical protein